MGKPTKRRIQNSRLTPKGTKPKSSDPVSISSSIAGRKNTGLPSPWWVPTLLFGFLILGAVVIILNYVGYVPGGNANNIYLLVGLGFILAGLITATQLR